MTVLSTINKVIYRGGSEQTLYPISFDFIKNEDIKVYIYDNKNVRQEEWRYSVQYVIENKNVKVLDGYTIDNTKKILIARIVDYVQDNKYREGGDFPAKSTETSFDKAMMAVQQLQEEAHRGLHVDQIYDIDSTIPAPDAGKALIWNEDGSGITNSKDVFDNIVSNAKESEENALQSEQNARNSEIASKVSEVNAKASAEESEASANRSETASLTPQVTTVYEDLIKDNSAIKTTAINIDNVNLVSGSITNVNTVAGIEDDVTTVAMDVDAVVNVSTNMAVVKNTEQNIDSVKTVSNSIDKVIVNAENITDINNANANAQLAKTSATNAKTSETNAKTSETNAKSSQNASKTSETNSRKWAEGTDSEVQPLGGVHSAKGWAEQAASVVKLDNATETTKGIIRLSTATEAETGTDNTTAMTPAKVSKVISDNAGRGNVLGFDGTLSGSTLTFESSDGTIYDLKNNFDYEIDLHFPATGTLDDSVKIVIKNGADEIVVRNIISGSNNATYGQMKQVCNYDVDFGWRWIFNARYKSVNGDTAFIMPSTAVQVDVTGDIAKHNADLNAHSDKLIISDTLPTDAKEGAIVFIDDSQAIAETPTVDYVVEWKDMTDDDKRGYAIYKSGRYECWGITTGAVGRTTIVTFPKEFADVNYVITGNPITTTEGDTWVDGHILATTTTSATFAHNLSGYAITYDWHAIGRVKGA